MKYLTLNDRPMLLRSINARNEKHGEEDVLRADLDFEMTCTVDDVAAIGLNKAKEAKQVVKAWRDLIYRAGDTDLAGDAMFREHCLDSIKFQRIIEGQHINMDGLDFFPVRLSKFAVSFDDDLRTLRLRFQAAINPEERLDEIAHCLGQTITVSLAPPAKGELLRDADPNEAAPASEETTEAETDEPGPRPGAGVHA